ncbi:sialoadhesin isoform X4 [Oreochromis niloticus]|uniref:sialoadhesin isoform X4 n=1 Tax=Oreochromis niloticus TaxID=8128 RepID=UPI000DF38D7B|nr:sialoadhesin isoform X4 [Oreochromis niloticus]
MHVKHVQRKEDSQISLLHFPTTESTVFRDSIFNTGRNCGWFTTCYMLCDLPADGIYETRGAAMSSTAAATGLVLFLLSLPVVQSQNDYGVTYTSTQICAVKGSTVDIGCSFKYPSRANVLKRVWFTKGNNYNLEDLKTDPVYAGRVSYSPQRKSCTLTIRDLRESDSAMYKFRFETDQKHFTGLPGVTLNVTALQVHVDTSSYPDWGTLTCQSSCRLHDRPSYIWYKNGQKISTQSGQYWYSDYLNPSDSYSCAVRGHEASTSPSVCVRGVSCNRVNYSNRSICAFKGSSVDISSTYNSYESLIQSTSWFRFGRGSEDLREDSRYAGRVEVIETERGRSTLRIRDLTESDSAQYHFKFNTQSFEWGSSLPGTTLTVTDVQVRVSTGRKLDCVTRCNPYVSSYVWYKNGQQVNGATSSSYEASYDTENSYSCALKGFEDFHSSLVCINGRWCNRVNYSKRRICAFKGSSVDISSTYNSYESLIQSTSWFRSGRGSEDLREDSQYAGRVEVTETVTGRSTLRIRDLTESDSAQYHFKFNTQSFEWGSSLPGTTLTVTVPQVKVSRIISVHESQTEAELKCESSCSPAGRLSFVWFKNGQKNTTQQTSTYTDYFYPGDNISCAFTGYEYYRSPPVYAPKFASVLVLNNSPEIMEGSSVNLTCSSDANPAANYTWYKDKKLISTEQQLIFSSIQSSDSGEYHCTAKNELGQRPSEVIFINVKYAPKLPSVSVSPSAGIVEGSSVNLTCSSDANPAANYTWYKENKSLFHGPVGMYHLSSISSEDSGKYSCKAENLYGPAQSVTLYIDVEYPPKLPSVSVSPSAEIVEGSSVTLTCSSDANPAANYTWYKEDEDSAKASGHNFTITDFRPEHIGSYYCVAQNTRGCRNSTLQLIVTAKFIIESVMILNIVRLTLVVLMPIALFVLGLWMRKKTHVALETGPNESVNVIKVNTHADCENVSDSQGVTAAQSDDTEEQEELL